MANEAIQFQHKGGFGFIEQDRKDIVRLRIEGVPSSDIYFPHETSGSIESIVFVDLSREQARLLAEVLLRGQSTDPA